MDQPQQQEQKKNNKPKIALSEVDNTLIALHNIYQGKPIVISLVLNVTKEGKDIVRTFQILDCFLAGTNEDFKKPDYLG